MVKQEFIFPKLRKKVDSFIPNCVPCILFNKKSGKQEGFLNPIEKVDVPFDTFHVDHLGPLESTNKGYHHILAVIDGFTKYCWLYASKSTTTKEVIAKLDLQQTNFGNRRRIITDRGSAFRSEEFHEYCDKQKIELHLITTSLPRSNGQIERLNRTIIPVLAKLSGEDPTKWYKYIAKLQAVLNSTSQRSIKMTPFELLLKMNVVEESSIKEAIEDAVAEKYCADRADLRKIAKAQINEVQNQNVRTYNLRRRPAKRYQLGDLVAIQRTQGGPCLKIKQKFLGPYRIVKVKPKDTYDVQKMVSELARAQR